MSLGAVFIAAFLVNNIILMKFLALCSFFGISDEIEKSAAMGAAVTFVMVVSSAIGWLIYYFILNPGTSIVTKVIGNPIDLTFLRTSVFILTIASFVQFIEMVLKKHYPYFYNAFGIFLPLITTNCGILGVAFLSIDYKYSFLETIIYALGASLGYILVIILLSGIREKLECSAVPKLFKGYPIVFFTAGLMSLAFLGFKALFGL